MRRAQPKHMAPTACMMASLIRASSCGIFCEVSCHNFSEINMDPVLGSHHIFRERHELVINPWWHLTLRASSRTAEAALTEVSTAAAAAREYASVNVLRGSQESLLLNSLNRSWKQDIQDETTPYKFQQSIVKPCQNLQASPPKQPAFTMVWEWPPSMAMSR